MSEGQTKICKRCNNNKSFDQFSKNSKSKDRLFSWCKPCFKNYENERYKNGDCERKKKNSKKIITDNQDYIWTILINSKCKNCSEDNPLVLEFDHIDPKNKSAEITTLFNRSKEIIDEEIQKCNVLCRNCHSIKTYTELNSWKIKRFNELLDKCCKHDSINNMKIIHNNDFIN